MITPTIARKPINITILNFVNLIFARYLSTIFKKYSPINKSLTIIKEWLTKEFKIYFSFVKVKFKTYFKTHIYENN